MESQNRGHSVRLDESKCIGCTTCIRTCPTEAIRVRNGKAYILNHKCIDCGVCIRTCPERAKRAVFDPLERMRDFRYTVALPAPTLYGQYNNREDVDVVLTGVGFAPEETGAAIRTKEGISYVSSPKVGRGYHGTGDLFAAAFTGAWMGGKSMEKAADIAAKFVCRCVENTFTDPNHWYGTKFETALPYLIELLK